MVISTHYENLTMQYTEIFSAEKMKTSLENRDLSGIFVGWAEGPSNKNSMGPYFSRGSGAARLPVGSRGNALVRGPGERSSPAEIRFKHFACA